MNTAVYAMTPNGCHTGPVFQSDVSTAELLPRDACVGDTPSASTWDEIDSQINHQTVLLLVHRDESLRH